MTSLNYTDLSEKQSILSSWVNQLRDVKIQKDRMRFRRNLERIGEVGALEISKTLPYKACEVTTPLGVKPSVDLAVQPVVMTILRAGLPLYQGVLNYFDYADSGFVAAYRKHNAEGFEIKQDYVTCPDISNRPLIVVDPMLATGASLCEAIHAVLKLAQPSELHILCAIAALPGIQKINEELPQARLWCATVDDKLDEKGYIIPGLGDAGDLCFGPKLQS
ncbi:uracil phosphoribosyltransferase [Ornithobacterium rhinotracheale]|uniref:Uracil phosphoribosyltransferase n=1 Tax=Ornithobacterium rhinotracheale TaxID=28251 RepID=A0A410JS01_ORNRH|nr:uracil phosphoribosyltransferase [Ornithobacterium rhinotracheale]QAR30950.1 uracil phosphoribosyltransferase [Ornithobacterium rhinotracheale]